MVSRYISPDSCNRIVVTSLKIFDFEYDYTTDSEIRSIGKDEVFFKHAIVRRSFSRIKKLRFRSLQHPDNRICLGDIFTMLNNADMKFGNIKDENGNEVICSISRPTRTWPTEPWSRSWRRSGPPACRSWVWWRNPRMKNSAWPVRAAFFFHRDPGQSRFRVPLNLP